MLLKRYLTRHPQQARKIAPSKSPFDVTFCTVHLGRLGKPFATRGWQSLLSFTNPPEQIFDYSDHLVISNNSCENDWCKCSFAEQEVRSDGILIRLADVDNRELASLYAGRIIAMDRRLLPAIDDGYYWCDIVGLKVFHHDCTTDQRLFYGTVRSLSSAGGSHDIIEVICDVSGKIRMIPFIEKVYIHRIDMIAGFIEVFWPSDY